MIGRRILVNLGVFVALFCLLAYWAVSNVVRFDFIERPYSVTAYFSNSPGLRDGFEVAYLGLRVGSIGAVELIADPEFCGAPGAVDPEADPDAATSGGGQAATGACVSVELKLDRGTELPADVRAFVRRKSAVGEPYVDLVVLPDAERDADGNPASLLQEGAHLTGGEIPLAYSDLFRAVNDLVQQIPEDSLGTFFRELAIGLDGRADELRTIVEGAHDLSGTLASDPQLLQDFTDEITALTHTLAEHRESFGSAVDNLALLADSLAANRQVLAQFLDESPEFIGRLTALLDAVDGDLTCALRSLSVVATNLAQPATLADVDRLLDVAVEAGDVLGGSLRFMPDGTWITGGFQFNVANGTPVPIYPEPHVLPDPHPLGSCGITFPPVAGAGGGAGTGAGGTASPVAGPTPADDTERPAADPEEIVDSTTRPSDADDLLGTITDALPYFLGLVVLAAVLAAVKPWRFLPGAKRDDGSSTEPTDEPPRERFPAEDFRDPDEVVPAASVAAASPDEIEDTLRS